MEEKEFKLIEVNKTREFIFSKKKCDHLEFYVNETEFMSTFDEFNLIKSGNFQLNKEIILKTIFCENDKNLPEELYILLIKNSKTFVMNIDYKKNTIMDFFIVDTIFTDFSHKFISVCSFSNWIYLMNNNQNSATIYLIETKKKKSYEIINTNESNELIQNYAYTFFDTKLIMFGGINKLGKLSNLINSFDISTYTFSNEKIRENKIDSRQKCGMIVIFGYIYIIGGYKSIKEEETNICTDVKFIKMDTLMNQWTDFPIEGSKPINIISPSLQLIFKRYLVAVSIYSGLNIFILDLMKKTGLNLNIKVSFLNEMELSNKIYFYNGKYFLPELKEKNEENSINLYEIKFIS